MYYIKYIYLFKRTYITYKNICKKQDVINSINICWSHTLTKTLSSLRCSLANTLAFWQQFWCSKTILNLSSPFAFLLISWCSPKPEFPSPCQGRALCYLEVPGSLDSLKIGSPKSWWGVKKAATPPTPARARLQATVSWKYTVFLFPLLGEASSSTWGFSKPFTVISSLTQHPCRASPSFREALWGWSAVEGQRGQRLTPRRLLRPLQRYIYGKSSLQIETESLS